MTADRLTPDEIAEIRQEIDSSFERLLCHPMNMPKIQDIAVQSMRSVIERIIAKSIAEHNKWIAEQKQDIAEKVRYAYVHAFQEGYHADDIADAIISLLVGRQNERN